MINKVLIDSKLILLDAVLPTHLKVIIYIYIKSRRDAIALAICVDQHEYTNILLDSKACPEVRLTSQLPFV